MLHHQPTFWQFTWLPHPLGLTVTKHLDTICQAEPSAAAGDMSGGAWREPDALSDSGASDATMAGPPSACAHLSPHAAAPTCDVRSESGGSCSDVCMDGFAACPLPERSPGPQRPAPPEAGDEGPSSEVSEVAHERGEAPQCEVSDVDAVLARYSVTPLAGPAAVPDFALARIRELVRSPANVAPSMP